MEPQIEQGIWLEADHGAGADYVSAHLVKIPDSLQLKEAITKEDGRFKTIVDQLKMHVNGNVADIIEIKIIEGFGARLSAPGYIDYAPAGYVNCTDWVVFPTRKEAEEYLEEQLTYDD